MITNNPAESSDQNMDNLLPEYSFDYQQARPNRFAAETPQQIITIILDPDIAEVFTTSESVNHALRALINALPKSLLQLSQ